MTREQYENWKRERALTIKRRRRKITTIVVALMLVVGTTIGTTVAWLTDSSETVTDTFTYGKVDIELIDLDSTTTPPTTWKESSHNNVNAGLYANNQFKLMPGASIAFNPGVKVESGSEACYVFIKVDVNQTLRDIVGFTASSAWVRVEDGVYAYATNVGLTALTAGNKTDNLMIGGVITVGADVTANDLENLTNTAEINVTAYAIQKDYLPNNITAAELWAIIKNNGVTPSPNP